MDFERLIPTGPLVSDVVPAQEVFPGRRREFLPDFIIRMGRQAPRLERSNARARSVQALPDRGRTGEHRFKGFACVLGPGARNDSLPPLAHCRDFPAFISHLLGVRR